MMNSMSTCKLFLKDLQQNYDKAWHRFDEKYLPLVQGWLLRQGIQPEDVRDIAQNVMVVLLHRLPEFERQREGSFRTWLKRITIYCLRDFYRKHYRRRTIGGHEDVHKILRNHEDPSTQQSRNWDKEHERHILRCAMLQAKERFSESTWAAFKGVALDGKHASEVAVELGISGNAVCIAKSRVCAKIRSLVERLM